MPIPSDFSACKGAAIAPCATHVPCEPTRTASARPCENMRWLGWAFAGVVLAGGIFDEPLPSKTDGPMRSYLGAYRVWQ